MRLAALSSRPRRPEAWLGCVNADGVIRSEGTTLPAGELSRRAAPAQAEVGRLDARYRSWRTGDDLRFEC